MEGEVEREGDAACAACGAVLPGSVARCPACGRPRSAVGRALTRAWSAAPAEARAEDLLGPGEALGGHRIERLLGQGGMGVVYLATQASLGRRVALKVLAARFTLDDAFVKRFDREAEALAALSHPHIVAIHDRGFAEGRYFLVMEYVDGVSLREILARGRPAPAEAARLMLPVCDALGYAHAKGVVHRDIKPENILVSRAGTAKLADFGLARLTEGAADPGADAVTATSTVIGTRDYMAPEARLSARCADPRSDLYAVGVVLYEILTGEVPLGRFPPPSGRGCPDRRLDAVVLKALEAEADRRYQTAGELSRDLARIAGSPAPAAGVAEALAGMGRLPEGLAAPAQSAFVAQGGASGVPQAGTGTMQSALAYFRRRPGEGRRQWRSRSRAMSFLALAVLVLLGLCLWPGPGRRLTLAPPLVAIVLVLGWVGFRKARAR